MKKLAVLICLLYPLQLEAVTYYVAQSGGSDSNSCVQAQTHTTAKATIAAGLSCLSSGDTLSIKPGTYARPTTPPPSGTSWIAATTVTAFDTANDPIITGGWPGFYGTGNASTSPRFIILDNLRLNGNKGGSPSTTEVLSLSNGTNNIRVINSEIYNSAGVCGICSANGGAPPSGISGAGSLEILNNLIHDNGAGTGDPQHGIYLYTPNNLIEGNEIYNTDPGGCGIQIYSGATFSSPGNIIRKNKLYSNGCGLSLRDASGILVYNNLIYQNVAQGMQLDRCSNAKIFNNSFFSNDVSGIDISSGQPSAQIRNNIFWQNGSNNVINNSMSTSCTANLSSAGTTCSSTVTGTSPFTNAAANDFTLAAGSNAAVGAGTSSVSADVPDDYIGTSRPQGGTYDIGAYERVAAGSDSLTLLQPNGGTLGAAGSAQTFTWSFSGTIVNVSLKYDAANDGTFETTLSASTANDGSFAFTAPAATTTGRFQVCDASDGTPCDVSDSNVTITAGAGGSITVIISDNTSGSKIGTINGTTNALLVETGPTTNFAGTSGVRANKFASGQHSHSVLRFPIPVVSGATVTAAELGLYLTAFTSAGTPSIDFRNSKRAFVQSEATWNSFSTGNAWGTAGGINNTTDRDSTVLCNMSISATTLQYYTCSHANLTAWVQAAMDGGGEDRLHTERNGTGNDGLLRTFGSNSQDSDKRPYLQITYTTTAATITVTQPISSSHFFPGDSAAIRWTSMGFSGPVFATISYNGGVSYQPTPIIDSHPFDQADAVWIVSGPASVGQARIKVCDLTTGLICGESPNFSIAGTTLGIR